MSRRPVAAAAAVVGAAAAAVVAAAGLLGARRRRTRRRRTGAVVVDSPGRDAPPPLSGRQRTVVAEDGVELAVTEHGSAAAAATFVLLHGHPQSGALWAGQVRDLLAARQHLRVVTYHRGHDGSGRAAPGSADLELLGRDLERVLDSVAPTGPVLLAGHATGGMAIMALAEQAPELFGQRIAGVALVATCSGALEEVAHGLPTAVAALTRRLRPRRGDSSAWSLPTFPAHDRLALRTAMAELPVLVVVGDRDRLCPLAHSRALAGALRAGELVVYPGAGHLVPLERRAEVSRRLLALLDRALARRDVAAVH